MPHTARRPASIAYRTGHKVDPSQADLYSDGISSFAPCSKLSHQSLSKPRSICSETTDDGMTLKFKDSEQDRGSQLHRGGQQTAEMTADADISAPAQSWNLPGSLTL
jgi:hypothetical protein